MIDGKVSLVRCRVAIWAQVLPVKNGFSELGVPFAKKSGMNSLQIFIVDDILDDSWVEIIGGKSMNHQKSNEGPENGEIFEARLWDEMSSRQ